MVLRKENFLPVLCLYKVIKINNWDCYPGMPVQPFLVSLMRMSKTFNYIIKKT
jgi:hypothetical protein